MFLGRIRDFFRFKRANSSSLFFGGNGMLLCSRYETNKVMKGEATAVAKVYGAKCPHKKGSEVFLTSKTINVNNNKPVPFARVQILSVRPGTVQGLKGKEEVYKAGGFSSGESWFQHLRRFYGGSIKSTTNVYNIRFRVLDLDVKAGTRKEVKAQ